MVTFIFTNLLWKSNFTKSTMKSFSIEKSMKVGSAGDYRLGTLRLTPSSIGCQAGGIGLQAENSTKGLETGVPRNDNMDQEPCLYTTPMYFIHTQSGSVPHITPEVLKLIYPPMSSSSSVASNLPPLQISLEPTINHLDSVKKFNKGIGKFVGLPQAPVFLTVHDSLQLLRSGYNDKLGIALWSRHGRTSLTPDLFVQAVNAFKPSVCQILSDYDVRPESSGMKRLKKSLNRAEEYGSFVFKEMSPPNKGVGLFITVEAAWFEIDEQLARKEVANLLESAHQLEGVIIEGLTNRFATSQNPPKKDSKQTGELFKVKPCTDLNLELVDRIVKTIPPCFPKYMPGPFRLPQMIDLISKGVDILDSSIATLMADNAEVFLLDDLEIIIPSLSRSTEKINIGVCEVLPDRCDVDDSTFETSHSLYKEEDAIIVLNDKRYFDDFRPISKSCTCYTCRKHTRSYVHHLYSTDELLGPVLVQIHNLTAINRFFQMIRGILQDSDSPETLQNNLQTMRKLVSKFSKAKSVASDDEHDNHERLTTRPIAKS